MKPFGMLFRKFRTDRDLSEELRAHFQELVEDGIEAGLTSDEAQRRARLKLGSAPEFWRTSARQNSEP